MNRRNALVLFALLGLAALLLGFFLAFVLVNNQKSGTGIAPTATSSGPSSCTGKGAVRNAGGSYTFSELHVNGQGAVVDANNCVVHLLGLNMGGLFLGAAGHVPLPVIQWYKQHIPMNVVREAFNGYWWQTDVYVPNQHMHFRQWLQTVVKWQEQSGNYVILDLTTQFHNPPCGTGVTVPCPSQNQANKNNPPDPTEKVAYQPTALSALTDLAKLYSHDPAVIFDVWNEPVSKEFKNSSEQVFFQSMNERINTVRQYDPNALIMVYQQGYSDIMSGQYPNYSQKSLLIDVHIYRASWTPGDTIPLVTFAHAHGQAVIVGEWGGAPGKPDPGVMIPFLKAYDVQATYFIATNLISGSPDNPSGLNSIGQAVAGGYGSIPGSP